MPAPDIMVGLPNICHPGEYELVHRWVLISASLIHNIVKYLSYVYELLMFPYLHLCFYPFSSGLGLLHMDLWDLLFFLIPDNSLSCYNNLQFLERLVELAYKLI